MFWPGVERPFFMENVCLADNNSQQYGYRDKVFVLIKCFKYCVLCFSSVFKEDVHGKE